MIGFIQHPRRDTEDPENRRREQWFSRFCRNRCLGNERETSGKLCSSEDGTPCAINTANHDALVCHFRRSHTIGLLRSRLKGNATQSRALLLERICVYLALAREGFSWK